MLGAALAGSAEAGQPAGEDEATRVAAVAVAAVEAEAGVGRTAPPEAATAAPGAAAWRREQLALRQRAVLNRDSHERHDSSVTQTNLNVRVTSGMSLATCYESYGGMKTCPRAYSRISRNPSRIRGTQKGVLTLKAHAEM